MNNAKLEYVMMCHMVHIDLPPAVHTSGVAPANLKLELTLRKTGLVQVKYVLEVT